MFKKMFKKKDQIPTDKYILVAALLVHAARIDNNYSETERKMIKKTIIDMGISKENEVEKILINAEKKEIWVTYPNGISKKNRVLFSPKVLDGSVITIGKKDESEPFDTTEYTKEVTSILANIAQIIILYKTQ